MQRMYAFQDPLSRIRTLPCSHGRGKGDFPHEIGLLLGYPPEDVVVLLKTGDKSAISDTGRYIPIWKNAGRYLLDMIRQGKKSDPWYLQE